MFENCKEQFKSDIKNILEQLASNGNIAEADGVIANIYDNLDKFSAIDNYVIREHLLDEVKSLEAGKYTVNNDNGNYIVTLENGTEIKFNSEEDFKNWQEKQNNNGVTATDVIMAADDEISIDELTTDKPAQETPAEDNNVEKPAEQPAEETKEEQPAEPVDDTEKEINDMKETISKADDLNSLIKSNITLIPDLDFTQELVLVQLNIQNLKDSLNKAYNNKDSDYDGFKKALNDLKDYLDLGTVDKDVPKETKYEEIDKKINEYKVKTDDSEEVTEGEENKESAEASTIMSKKDEDGEGDFEDKESEDAPTGEDLEELFDKDKLKKAFSKKLDENFGDNEDFIGEEETADPSDLLNDVKDLVSKLFKTDDEKEAKEVKKEIEEKIEEVQDNIENPVEETPEDLGDMPEDMENDAEFIDGMDDIDFGDIPEDLDEPVDDEEKTADEEDTEGLEEAKKVEEEMSSKDTEIINDKLDDVVDKLDNVVDKLDEVVDGNSVDKAYKEEEKKDEEDLEDEEKEDKKGKKDKDEEETEEETEDKEPEDKGGFGIDLGSKQIKTPKVKGSIAASKIETMPKRRGRKPKNQKTI